MNATNNAAARAKSTTGEVNSTPRNRNRKPSTPKPSISETSSDLPPLVSESTDVSQIVVEPTAPPIEPPSAWGSMTIGDLRIAIECYVADPKTGPNMRRKSAWLSFRSKLQREHGAKDSKDRQKSDTALMEDFIGGLLSLSPGDAIESADPVTEIKAGNGVYEMPVGDAVKQWLAKFGNGSAVDGSIKDQETINHEIAKVESQAVTLLPSIAEIQSSVILSTNVTSGLASMFQAATRVSAADRATALIRENRLADPSRIEWTLTVWERFGFSRKTIAGCVGWKEVLKLRAENKLTIIERRPAAK